LTPFWSTWAPFGTLLVALPLWSFDCFGHILAHCVGPNPSLGLRT
jgi:hypothetical protein